MFFSDLPKPVGPSRMAELGISAESFAAAIDRVCAHRDHPVVVKLGGSAMEDPVATEACLKSVAALSKLRVPLVLVHGGGKAIDRAMAEAGLTPKKVAGRRYTDDATLKIVVHVLKDEINLDLEARLRDLSVAAFAVRDVLFGERLTLTGEDGQPVDLGRVGKITGVDARVLKAFIRDGELPIIPSLARDTEGKWLNINADTAASAVAGALKADKAIFLTDTPGVLRDQNDANSLIPLLNEREARELIASGVIEGGMVPKVEACFEALDAGAKTALILDGRAPYSLLDVFLHNTFTGTAITR